MKRFFFGLPLVLIAILLWGFIFPVSGGAVDYLLSAVVSGATKQRIIMEKTQIRQWSSVAFKRSVWLDENRAPVLETGAGKIHWRGFRFDCRIRDITIRSYKTIPFAASSLKKLFGPTLRIDLFAAVYRWRVGRSTFHVYRCESDQVSLRGGTLTQKGRLAKAFVTLAVSPAIIERLPKQAREFGIVNGDWRQWRLLYNRQLITLIGTHGPFFKMTWQRGK